MVKDCEYHKIKYKNIPKNEFCGKYGGEKCEYTYPVNTPKRAIAAMSYARHAPNPEGIRRCVRHHSEKKGWIDPDTNMIRRDRIPPEVVELDDRFYLFERDGYGGIIDIRPLN